MTSRTAVTTVPEAINVSYRPSQDLLVNARREGVRRGLDTRLVVDIDCHIMETVFLREIAAYIPDARLRQQILGATGARDMILPASYGDREVGGRIFRDSHNAGSGGGIAIADLVSDMDLLCVDVAVAFPTPMLSLGLHPQVEVEVALAQGYNRWLIDQYLAKSDRLTSMLYLPVSDPEAACREVEELGDAAGVVGFMVTSVRRAPVYHRSFFPLYRMLEERSLPLAFHGGPRWDRDSMSGQLNRFLSAHALDFPMFNMIHMMNIVVNGIPERFPGLKLIFLEGGLSYLFFLAERLDHEYMMRPSEAPLLKGLPSDYMRKFYYGTQPMECASSNERMAMVFDMLNGETQFLYSSDYPHWDFDLPSRIFDLPFLSDQGRVNILGENARRLFGERLKLPASARHA
jgi:uncharacterized protein